MNTLAQIPDSFRLYACCGKCARMEFVDREAVIEESGDLSILEFRARVRCGECGKRTEDIRIVYHGNAVFQYREG